MINSPFLREGQKIYKADGTVGAVMARDVYEGEEIAPEDFEHVDGKRPKLNEQIPDWLVPIIMDRSQYMLEPKHFTGVV